MISHRPYRAALPLSVTEKLITMVSDKVREHLIDHQALTPQTAGSPRANKRMITGSVFTLSVVVKR